MVQVTFSGDDLNDVAGQARAFADTVLGTPINSLLSSAPPFQQPDQTPPDQKRQEQPDLTQTKEQALEKLRTVYGKPGGADAVKKALARFKVKKAADVPVERAAELLVAAEEAELSLPAEQ